MGFFVYSTDTPFALGWWPSSVGEWMDPDAYSAHRKSEGG